MDIRPVQEAELEPVAGEVVGLLGLEHVACPVVNLTVRGSNHGARALYGRLGFAEERLIQPWRRGFSPAHLGTPPA